MTAPALAAPFDRSSLRAGIVHIGLGGFARAHLAAYTHDLMVADARARRWGIVGAGLRAADRGLLGSLARQDCLYTLVERDGDGERARVIGSLAGVVDASGEPVALLRTIDDPGVTIVTITVTEHGYCLDRATRRLDLAHPAIAREIEHPHAPSTAIGVIVEAMAQRRARGGAAPTVLSLDNIPHNGAVLRGCVLALAARRDDGLAAWIDRHAAFPSSMVDRITPAPTVVDRDAYRSTTGIVDEALLVCEPFRQWVIEDRFIGDRPAWETVGVQFVRDVTPYETMKLRLLNASHLALAGLGALIGYERVDEAIGDPLLRRYLIALMDRETGPSLAAVPGIDLADYKRTLLRRFANPAIRDTLARINADAPINYLLDPIAERLAAGRDVTLLALALAAWLRRARGEDERGARVEFPHPLAAELRRAALTGGTDPGALLAIEPLFGALGRREALRAAASPWLRSLYEVGAEATLSGAAVSGLI